MARVSQRVPFCFYLHVMTRALSKKILSKTSQISTALFFILRSGSQKCGHFLVRFFLFGKIRPLIDSTRV
ncbi:hypothetical protein BBB52_01535 [Aggregatibacter aphrophilus]|uniref:Uncharacterized protein n=1 Tax=Aggregatibacter aphrophilus TaxID=732 RepID=A0AAP7L3Y9_AGGAP|nr:hypothetical protein ATCC33389_0210570 [Aggregatibacter aphrophilus ATCC 33389]OBY50547.1 hypothetical protein BBB51_09135 [Aggregatibacter aphrophilus]OBY54158.1 hypothetical protein BBB52_01535 [Aggregatibacter aphrophilus]